MDIRLLTETDAEQFWRFRLLALQSEPRAFASSPEEHQAISLEQTAERLRPVADGSFVIGAFNAETLVGTAGFYRDTRPKTRHKGTIWGVYVAASHRGRGIGRAMLNMAVDRIRTYAGMRQVQLAVGATQTAAERMYQSLGFETFGLERDAINTGGEFVDEYWMVLRL
jgi:ribosomal protein S18 acetylase RimI-like enzyme